MVEIDNFIGSKEYESYGRIKICDLHFIHIHIIFGIISRKLLIAISKYLPNKISCISCKSNLLHYQTKE